MYLDKLQMWLGEATVWRALQYTCIYPVSAIKASLLMNTDIKSMLEHNKSHGLQYMFNIGSEYDYEQLMFVNESAFDQHATYRQYFQVLKGLQVQQKCFYVRGKRYVVIWS
ncbi:hypothetical protein PAXRUDRAFT_170201 [Paxillus rubicundulus Ve08.2h10]|uniref:Unplaced genomic scaffold scaffold_2714, whole genome shotgun sequence n=1 Tax=Paxillus rubicundulus Ve08.2h10 TaxID=930991 RepID=A0A0D0BZ13_9AGAM|nr:hypothetical protein PAXRUDRAFT_170201 [Paxillus rubicundulus Ve08.2h10]